MQERGEHIPPEESFDVARRAKEMYCYTCSDIVKVLSTSGVLNVCRLSVMLFTCFPESSRSV
jgi:hypothetical protein